MPAALARAAVLLTALLQLGGCRSQTEEQKQQAQIEGRHPDGTSPRSVDDRIPPFEAAEIGQQPGYLADAAIYASATAGKLGALWQALPQPRSELAAIGGVVALLDGDPAARDMLESFGIDPDARVSLSIRALGDRTTLRTLLDAGGPKLDELSAEGPRSDAAKAVFLQAAHGGVHLRLASPIADRDTVQRSLDEIWANYIRPDDWAQTCAAIGPTMACGGDRFSFVAVRWLDDGCVIDLMLTGNAEPDDPERRALIEAGVALPGGVGRAEAAALAGDAAVFVDGPGLIELVRDEQMRSIYAALEQRAEAQTVADLREVYVALARLHGTERVFEGMTVELAFAPGRVLVRGRWLPSPGASERLASVFALDPVDADVPSIAALCDGALVCGRSRGLPARDRFVGLAKGLYDDPDTLQTLLEHDEASLVLLLETWPNAIGSTSLLPARLGNSPETMVMQSVVEIGARVLGFGFAVRPRGDGQARLVYARMSGADIDSVRSVMQLGGSEFSTVALDGVDARVESTRMPTPQLFGRFYAVNDPDGWGWAVASDSDDQIAWLAALAHDDGAVPLLYFEVPDLGRLIGSDPALDRDFGFWKEKLGNKGVRAQLGITPDRAPELRIALGKVD